MSTQAKSAATTPISMPLLVGRVCHIGLKPYRGTVKLSTPSRGEWALRSCT